jgi:uncharacterized protein
MSTSRLFPENCKIGIFRGFSEGGLEFHADLVLPYRPDFQCTPMHGLFLLVQLENDREAVLGRITSFHSEGRLSSSAGEDYGIRAVMEERPIPENLREQYLKYRVNIRVLGVLRENGEKFVFAPSHRRLPHVGSKVARLSPEVLTWVAGHHNSGAELGYYALGEFVYSGSDERLEREPWMRILDPRVIPRFDIQHLIARRSFIFARAGYGKSNLNKLLFSALYGGEEIPTVPKAEKRVPVGTIIFDPDGEYFWPDDKGKPGLCDVPGLEERLVVFTARKHKSAYYNSFVAGEVRLDIRRLRPADVVSIALSPEKQDQQNVNKLKGMSPDRWTKLVDAVAEHGNQTDISVVREALNLKDERSDVEATAALSNLTRIVRMLHDPSSRMLDNLLAALKDGCLCVVDVSQLRGEAAFVLSGLLLQRIFDHNLEMFTDAGATTIPTLAVVEEAQTVLGAGVTSSAMRPYVEWVKEGRKYDLGAVLVTQRPGSISDEILSQGDNWFVFHLLSSRDLGALRNANAHYSDDLLGSLLNEPIKGNGVFWSSEGGQAYPLPVRVLDFARMYKVHDARGDQKEARSWALKRRSRLDKEAEVMAAPPVAAGAGLVAETPDEPPAPPSVATDEFTVGRSRAIETLFADKRQMEKLRGEGLSWGRMKHLFLDLLPKSWEDRDDVAYNLVKTFMETKFGPQDDAWHTEPDNRRGAIVRLGKKP